ncbi:MAG: hemerythrin domain-containing protein [Deltaproteobacteria bacterium]|nr:hemerythrin domain-containing protein [Deltaproteobacteria bacterium]
MTFAPGSLTVREPVAATDTIFQVLAHEHRDLEAELAALHVRAAENMVAARAMFPKIAAAILAHLHAEDAVLMPRLAQIPGLSQMLAGSRADHARVESETLALDRPNLTDSEWLRALRRLEAELVRLIEREEAHVYPAARRALPPEEAKLLARELRRIEDRELALMMR